jgi:hypothetical protein
MYLVSRLDRFKTHRVYGILSEGLASPIFDHAGEDEYYRGQSPGAYQ